MSCTLSENAYLLLRCFSLSIWDKDAVLSDVLLQRWGLSEAVIDEAFRELISAGFVGEANKSVLTPNGVALLARIKS